MESKCKNSQCTAKKYGNSDNVAVPSRDGKIKLLWREISYNDWMHGICLDCITESVEHEGYFSETSPADYMDADQLNQGWGYY